MSRLLSLLVIFLLPAVALRAQNQPPTIANLSAVPNWANSTLTVYFDVFDVENDPLEITVEVSANSGRSYALTGSVIATGDVGANVAPGSGKSVTLDLSQVASTAEFTVRVTAIDAHSLDLAALVAEVDSNRLRDDLSFVEGVRHRNTGAAHLGAVRDSMADLFSAQGLFVEDHAFNYTNYTGHNYIGHLPGTASSEIVVIDAHYDTVNNAPGADDNGSGTVGVWEAARLLSRYPAKKSLRFIGFDLEESGLVGSQRYVTRLVQENEAVAGVFNFEMIGFYSEEPNTQELPAGFNLLFPAAYNAVAADNFRGNFISNVGNVASTALGTLFDTTAAEFVPELRVISLYVPGDGQIAPDLRRSDHTPFWEAGFPALMLTDGANFRNECYHTPGDTAENKLNFTFMANVVRATVASAARLAEIQHGDWATVTVQNPSNTYEPVRCTFLAQYSTKEPDFLVLTIDDCFQNAVQFDLLDAAGSLVLTQTVAIWKGQREYRVALPQNRLAAGTYVARIQYGAGSRAMKVVVVK